MVRSLRTLLYGLLLRCPACHRGRIFHSLFTINRHCPVCGVTFERDPGEVTGGMAITLVVTSTLTVVVGGLLALLTRVPLLPLLTALCLFTVLFALLFYRHARGLWASVIYLTRFMHED